MLVLNWCSEFYWEYYWCIDLERNLKCDDYISSFLSSFFLSWFYLYLILRGLHTFQKLKFLKGLLIFLEVGGLLGLLDVEHFFIN